MYRIFLKLKGNIDDAVKLNNAIEKETGIADFFDTESEDWRAWVEYEDGETLILEEVAE